MLYCVVSFSVGYPGKPGSSFDFGLRDRRRLRIKYAPIQRPMAAMPPTTAPAIAPEEILFPEGCAVVEGVSSLHLGFPVVIKFVSSDC